MTDCAENAAVRFLCSKYCAAQSCKLLCGMVE